MTNALLTLSHMQDLLPWLAPIALLLWFIAHGRQASIPYKNSHGIILISLVLLYLAFNVLLHRSYKGIAPVEFVRTYGRLFYVLGFAYIFYLIRPQVPIEQRLYPTVLRVGALIAAASLFTFFIAPLQIGSFESGIRTHLDGFLGGHNPAAGSFGLLIILFAVAIRNRDGGRPILTTGPLNIACAAIVFIAFAIAESRGYTLALFASIACLITPPIVRGLLRQNLSVKLASVTAIVLVGGGITGWIMKDRLVDIENDPAVLVRFALFERAWEMGQESPVFGVGLGSFEQRGFTSRDVLFGLLSIRTSGEYREQIIRGTASGGQHVHNLYLQAFAELGVVGLALLLGLVFFGLRKARRVKENSPNPSRRFNADLVIYFTPYLLVAGLTAGYPLMTPSIAWLYYLALGRIFRNENCDSEVTHDSRLVESPQSLSALTTIKENG